MYVSPLPNAHHPPTAQSTHLQLQWQNNGITAKRKITAQNSRSAAVPYENVYADSFFGLSGAPGKGKGLLQQGPVGEYREMQLPLKRNFSSLQTPLVQNVSRYTGLHIYIYTNMHMYLCVCMYVYVCVSLTAAIIFAHM